MRLEEYTDRDGNPRTSPVVNANDIQFLGQRVESADRAAEKTEENNQFGEEIEEEEVAKPATSRNGKRPGSKRASTKEAVNIEEDNIPF